MAEKEVGTIGGGDGDGESSYDCGRCIKNKKDKRARALSSVNLRCL